MTTQPRSQDTVRVDAAAATFVMERVFDAPPDLVFHAFSEPERLTRWWGPKGWTLPYCEMDFRPGGTWRYAMRGPDGTESWGKATYLEIEAPARIVYEDRFTGADGEAAPGAPVATVTLDFIDLGGRTRLVSTARFESPSELDQVIEMGMEQGLRETWDRLAEDLAGA